MKEERKDCMKGKMEGLYEGKNGRTVRMKKWKNHMKKQIEGLYEGRNGKTV